MKQKILNCMSDSFLDLFTYNRKEDEDLDRDDIRNCVRNGIITRQELIDAAIEAIDEGLEEYNG